MREVVPIMEVSMTTHDDENRGTADEASTIRLPSEQVAALLDRPPRPTAEELARMIRENRAPIQVAPGHQIHDPVVLHSCEFDHRIEIRGVTFHERVDLSDAWLHKTLDLTGCTFLRGLDMGGARVEGSLGLDACTFGVRDDERRRRHPGSDVASAFGQNPLGGCRVSLHRAIICLPSEFGQLGGLQPISAYPIAAVPE